MITSLRTKVLPCLIAVLALGQGCSQPFQVEQKPATVPVVEAKQLSFAQGTLQFSSDFPSARLHHVEQRADGLYRLVIAPENTPVNDSPWYAFKVVSTRPQVITMQFDYRNGSHRYHPKLSVDKQQWQVASAQQYRIDSQGVAQLTLSLEPGTLWVSAQELSYSEQPLRQWTAAMAEQPFIAHEVIGQSLEGRPLDMLQLGNPRGPCSVALLGRQHPPEITGSIALLAFVERLADNSELARRYRQQCNTLIFPLINPDGVARGHWRHSMSGVDLNRDWYSQRQPEIQTVALRLTEQASKPGQTMRLAVDFHSTWHNVFYTVQRQLVNPNYQIIDRWLAAIEKRFPELGIEDKPGTFERGVAKNWFTRDLDVPGLTYEVGDDVERDSIQAVAEYAAETMMQLLLEQEPLSTQ